MNKQRRKDIQSIMEKLEAIKSELETVRDDEQYYMDSIPENLTGSERYEKAEEAVSNLEGAYDNLDEAIGMLESAME